MNDRTAIKRCRNGDPEAFRHIVEQYQSQALGHATAIVGNRDDAMDAVQEAFIDTFQALESLDLDRKFYPWFYIILRNRCYKLTHARKQHEVNNVDEMESR
ncbi:MAG TPA: sigma-70 family RNA polymerase sigma factor [Pyrinomonadaceae bacterium]